MKSNPPDMILKLFWIFSVFHISKELLESVCQLKTKTKKSLWDDDRDYVESTDQFGENCDLIEFSNP